MDFNLTLIGQTVSMIVFVWFSMKFIWPVLMNVIETRRKEIADGIASSIRTIPNTNEISLLTAPSPSGWADYPACGWKINR